MTSIFLNKYSLGYKLSLKGDNSIDSLFCKNNDVEYNIAILTKRLECKGISGVRLEYLFTGDDNIICSIFSEYKEYLSERYMLCESDDEVYENEGEDENNNDIEDLVLPISQIIKSFWCNVCLKNYKNQKDYDSHFSKSKKHKSDKYIFEKKIQELTKENKRLTELVKKQEEELEKYKEEKDKIL